MDNKMIGAIGSTQLNSWNQVSNRGKAEAQTALFAVPKINDSQSIVTNIWEELAQTYNMRNATFDEVKEVAAKLYKAGEITFKEVVTLTFDYEKATNYIKQHAPVYVSANFTMYETEVDKSGRRDWIAEFGARAAKDRQYGNLVGYAAKTRILHILQQFEK